MTLDFLVQMNILGLLILMIVLFNLNILSRSEAVDRLFALLFFVSLSTLIVDTVSHYVGDTELYHVFIINFIFVSIIQINNILPFIIWISISVKESHIEKIKQKRIKYSLLSIWGIIILLILTNPFTGLMFTFDETYHYIRGPLFLIYPFLNTILTVFGLYVIIKWRKRLSRPKFLGLLLFIIPAGIGGLLQSFLSEYVTYWTGVSLGVLILFLYILSEYNQKDHLSGFFKKRHIINVIKEYEIEKIKYMICVVKILLSSDKESYKNIEQENIIIKETSQFLQEQFNDIGTLSRYTNNSFILLIRASEKFEIDGLQSIINESIEKKTDIHLSFYINEYNIDKINAFLD